VPDEHQQFASAADGTPIHHYIWRADASPRAIVVIAHGAAEHALRYERFARALNAACIEVWAPDHRGHGATAKPDALGDFGDGGWDAVVADLAQLIAMAHAARPGLPLALFGHSMGAAVAQQFTQDGSRDIDALVLSGSTARDASSASPVPPNAAFEPARTPYDWLSRDEAEVDAYAADPLCGFDMGPMRRPGQHADPGRLGDAERLARIRHGLPCLFLAGTADPINRSMEGMRLLESWWHGAGIERIDTLYYEGGRHEMLNETNRGEVTGDVIAWLLDALALCG
jgi:alpha-beta hydrolase superfamily lysophospholipase